MATHETSQLVHSARFPRGSGRCVNSAWRQRGGSARSCTGGEGNSALHLKLKLGLSTVLVEVVGKCLACRALCGGSVCSCLFPQASHISDRREPSIRQAFGSALSFCSVDVRPNKVRPQGVMVLNLEVLAKSSRPVRFSVKPEDARQRTGMRAIQDRHARYRTGMCCKVLPSVPSVDAPSSAGTACLWRSRRAVST